jgi:hypothetical protein
MDERERSFATLGESTTEIYLTGKFLPTQILVENEKEKVFPKLDESERIYSCIHRAQQDEAVSKKIGSPCVGGSSWRS